MLLGRLRVRQKLVLLVLPLLVLVVVGAVPLVAGRVVAAQRSADDVKVVQRAVRIGELIQELQLERLASLGFLSGDVSRDQVVARSARVLELAQQLDTAYGGGDDQLSSVLRAVSYRSGLDGIRIQVLGGRPTGIAVYSGFTEVVSGLIGALGLPDHADRTTAAGRQQLALDSIIRHDEAIASAGAALFTEDGRRVTVRVIGLVSTGLAIEDREESTFVALAEPSTVELYQQVEDGQSSTRLTRFLQSLIDEPGTVVDDVVAADLLPRVQSLTSLSRLVGTRVAAQAVEEADSSAASQRLLAGLGFAIAMLVVLGAAILSVLVTRSISRPLRRLTASADEVADVAQQELVRVADSDDPQTATPHLRPVRVGTSDELGELAQAFNRVQQVAADLVERQLVSRRNVATMFGNVGRRTQNLVGRQLAMIDSLERNEQDPALLDRLYRLDHVSTRLRRNANSLVVLSGATDQQITGEPLSVADTIRSALGEIEGFQRVRLGEVDSAVITPQVTPDVILLLAELLENGTSFSPPHTEVEVDAHTLPEGGVVVRIVDHGLGMTAEQLAAENDRLVERERLDLAPTDVLGLFVVGRLARRHGIEVVLASTPGTGVTAEVRVPERHLVGAQQVPVPSRPDPEAPAAEAPAEGAAAGVVPHAVPDSGAAPGRGAGVAGASASVAAAAPVEDPDDRGWWEPVASRRGAADAVRRPSLPVGRAEAPPAPSAPPLVAGQVPAPRPVPTRPVGATRAPWPRVGSANRTSGGPPAPVTAGRPGGGEPLDRPGGDGPGRGGTGRTATGAGERAAAGPGGKQAQAGPGASQPAADVPVPLDAVGPGGEGSAGPGEDVPATLRAVERSGEVRVGSGAGPVGVVRVGPGGEVPAGQGGDVPAGSGDEVSAGPGGDMPVVPGGEVPAGPRRVQPAAAGPEQPPGTRPGGTAGMVRRVRGAQLPDTGAPARSALSSAPPSADEARRSIEDFEAGVQQALRDTGAIPDAGLDTREQPGGPAPWGQLDRDAPGDAGQTRALVEEFEDGVRRALARLDRVTARPVPEPAPLFERPSAASGDAEEQQPAGHDDEPRELPPVPPRGDESALPARREAPPRRLDAGASRADTVLPLFRGHPDPRPLERRQVPEVAGPGRPDRGTRVTAFRPDPAGGPAVPPDPGAGAAGVSGHVDPRPVELWLPEPAGGPGSPPGPAAGTGNGLRPDPDGPPAGYRLPPDPDGPPARYGTPLDPPDPPGPAAGDGDSAPGAAEPPGPRPIGAPSRNGTPAEPAGEDGEPSGSHLVRRVPGAQLPAGARAAKPGIPAGPPPADAALQDAAAARALVEEFEAGVQRALQDGGDRPAAGSDEEGSR